LRRELLIIDEQGLSTMMLSRLFARLGSAIRSAASTRRRVFPVIQNVTRDPARPISFVVVRFSSECEQNIKTSPDILRPLNQLIVVDNTANLWYSSVAEAINAGVDRAQHDLVAIVHEDVYLPEGWQAKLELSLSELEATNPHWGVLGAAGLSNRGVVVGHYSDPHTYRNSFSQDQCFTEVDSIDEHLMLIRKSSGLRMDAFIPGIHGIGADVVLTARERSLKCYVIDAPTVHKYRNATGAIIQSHRDSPKIAKRASYAYIADKLCCDEYVSVKWKAATPFRSVVTTYQKWEPPSVRFPAQAGQIQSTLDAPIILLAKGGGGSRLLSSLAADCGVFVGNNVNVSGDALEMVMAVYQGVIEKFKCRATWQGRLVPDQLRLAAAEMLLKNTGKGHKCWGFKLPETLFLLPEMREAFPRARYVQMLRRPVDTCLRRPHMTARLDNEIGRVTLPLAYQSADRALEHILSDSPAVHMAYTTLHQLRMSLDYCRTALAPCEYFEFFFEDLLDHPTVVTEKLASWLDAKPVSSHVRQKCDARRARTPSITYPPEVVFEVQRLLAPLQEEMGYSAQSMA
jgi:hypothetical protein